MIKLCHFTSQRKHKSIIDEVKSHTPYSIESQDAEFQRMLGTFSNITNVDRVVQYALFYEDQGNVDKTEEIFNKCYSSNQSDIRLITAFVSFYERQDDFDKAEELLNKFVEKNHTVGMNQLSLFYERQGKIDEAIKCLTKTLTQSCNMDSMIKLQKMLEFCNKHGINIDKLLPIVIDLQKKNKFYNCSS